MPGARGGEGRRTAGAVGMERDLVDYPQRWGSQLQFTRAHTIFRIGRKGVADRKRRPVGRNEAIPNGEIGRWSQGSRRRCRGPPMSRFEAANLIRVFDFYLASMFLLSFARRYVVYWDAVRLLVSLRGRWPKVLDRLGSTTASSSPGR